MGCEVVLEEWDCVSEIKQNLNKIKATPCKTAEEINFGKGASHTGSHSTTGSNGVLGRFGLVGQK